MEADSENLENDNPKRMIDEAMWRELRLRMDLLSEIEFEGQVSWGDRESFGRHARERAEDLDVDFSEEEIDSLYQEIESKRERIQLHKLGIYEQSLEHSEELEHLRHQATIKDILNQTGDIHSRRIQFGLRTISILFLAADPTDASRLRLGEEFREIQEKLKLAKLRDNFTLELPQLSVRPADISQALLDVKPQIVHFSGHGTSTGALCFENQVGETRLIQPDALAALFEQFTKQVDCVLLNACYSEIQAKAIAKHVDYVIGMNQAIGDRAAIAFSIGFYQALGAGRTIEEAHKMGVVQIRLQDIPEHLTPVLIKKEQV